MKIALRTKRLKLLLFSYSVATPSIVFTKSRREGSRYNCARQRNSLQLPISAYAVPFYPVKGFYLDPIQQPRVMAGCGCVVLDQEREVGGKT